jgi:hypothetical protein
MSAIKKGQAPIKLGKEAEMEDDMETRKVEIHIFRSNP